MARMKFKLLVGVHQGPDYSQEPNKAGKYPTKTFTAGETVESEVDLVAKHGHEKFQLLASRNKAKGTGNTTPGDPTPDNLVHSTAHFPGGQVSTGFQSTSGANTAGAVRSGPMDPEDVEEDDEVGGPVERQHVLPNESSAKAPPKPKGEKADKGKSAQPTKGKGKEAKTVKEEEEVEEIDLAKLERMSTSDLQELAENQEIDLKGATKREEIIKIIKEECGEE